MRLAYVAGPYRAGEANDCIRNINSAIATARTLSRHGFAVLTPHSLIFDLIGTQADHQESQLIDEMCMRWIDGCDLLVTYEAQYGDGYWNSRGTRAEVRYARERGIPVMTLEGARAGAAS